ncbi:hypothetical protein EMPS_10065 [Entomortierella parvispora]|uniref:TM2 domain-containing protein n=1 Tax=Entomortierella parvispora TaxID=205924 RepID=A0A9P3HJC8_9FUNG|nr:hypothetical protein EMPS_10065 [Entomortierella parvispora]
MSSKDANAQTTPLVQEHDSEEPSQATESDRLLPNRDLEQGKPPQDGCNHERLRPTASPANQQGFGSTINTLFGATTIPVDSREDTLNKARAELVWCCCLLVLIVILFAILGPIFHFRNKETPPTCYSDRGYYSTVFLSIFLGFSGIDRFYLGYFLIGLLKFCTGGFFGILWALDIVLVIVGGLPDIHGCALP